MTEDGVGFNESITCFNEILQTDPLSSLLRNLTSSMSAGSMISVIIQFRQDFAAF